MVERLAIRDSSLRAAVWASFTQSTGAAAGVFLKEDIVMAGKINLLGHPVHPMVITFPLGLLPAAVVCDIIFLVHGGAHWAHFAYWLIAAGVLAGLFAAIFGFVDWLALPNGTRAKRVGLWHAG